MNFRQYLDLIQKSIQLKAGSDMMKLLPFMDMNISISSEIFQGIQDIPKVFLILTIRITENLLITLNHSLMKMFMSLYPHWRPTFGL
jgi:hypothetical protein